MLGYFGKRRGALAAVAMASAIALVGTIPATAASAEVTATKWNTYSGWDGASFVQPFGNPDTATYGQWFTAPDGVKKIKNWSFFMSANAGTGTMVFTGGLYTWDGTKAVDKVWESKEMSIDLTQGDPTVHKITLKPKRKGKVKPGQNYVMFLSVSKTYEETAPNVLSQWAANYTDVLPSSDVVFLNNGGDEAQWTTMPWTTFTGFDFAMKAKFK